MTFEEWIKFGFDQGWCGPDVCETHDGLPLTEAQAEEFETSDPCIYIVRLYDSPEIKAAVEAAHSPSKWRASNQGW